MKRALLIGLIVGAAVAWAQDRTITVREIDIQPVRAVFEMVPDGGCLFSAAAIVVSPSVEHKHATAQYPFNGARCATLRNAILQAAKNDMSVGSGANP
jgi:hypothetical protein